jgi:hypothetical protein
MQGGAPTGMEPVRGISLEQYAGVTAAVDDGIPLGDVLASEGIAPDAWPAAARAWKVRAAKAGSDGAVLVALREKRAVAEDCLARRVSPVDSELAAWMSFLRAYAAHAAPFELLRAAGLGLNDMARLQRRWAKRMAAEPKLEREAADLAKSGLGPMPALRVAPVTLKPFPWTGRASSAAAPPPPKALVAVPADTRLAPGQLRFYSYVAIKARLAENPGEEARVLREVGATDFAKTDAEWQEILGSNAELEQDYRRLLAKQRATLKSRAKATPAPPTAKPSAARAPELAPEAALAPPSVGARIAVVAASTNKLAGTSLAIEPPRAALPFAAPAAPAAPPPPDPGKASPKAPARSPLAGTALAVEAPGRAALPFVPRAVATGPTPPLTLEQHASLTHEIAVRPAHALETVGRYGLTLAAKVATDEHYAARFAREPGLRERWEEARRTYAAFLEAVRAGADKDGR